MSLFKKVEFRTFDGITLRGDLYEPARQNAPILIVTQGIALLKDHYLFNWAEAFQAAGYAVLVYDHRNWGVSDGLPRNEVNLALEAEDYSAAVTFALTLTPIVDPSRVVLWGIGHSGGAAATAAAMDPRIKGAILVIPSLNDVGRFPQELIEKMWKLRETGKIADEYIKLWPENEDEATNPSASGNLLSGSQMLSFHLGAQARLQSANNPYSNKMTLNSLYHLLKVRPSAFFPQIQHKVLYLPPTGDPFGATPEEHRVAFDTIPEGKKTWYQLKESHLDNYFGAAFEDMMRVQVEWLEREI